MPISPTHSIITRAFRYRYGVPAVNIVDYLSMRAVIEGATTARSPVIVQTSVKTVRAWGAARLAGMFRELADPAPVPVALHLDHCPHRDVISTCIRQGWNSVLFDGSSLSLEDNQRQTGEVVVEAHAAGVDVEGEIEPIQGVEDDHGSDSATVQRALDEAVGFIKHTGVDLFAPAIGNAHGHYSKRPDLDSARVDELVVSTGVPMVLHGGSGLDPGQFADLISRGCAKINISTALKDAYIDALRNTLTREPAVTEPLAVFDAAAGAIRDVTVHHANLFDSAGRAS